MTITKTNCWSTTFARQQSSVFLTSIVLDVHVFFQFADEHAKLAGPAGVPMSSMLSAGTDEPEAAVDPSYGVNNPFLEDQGSAAAAQPQQYYDASGQLTTGDPSQQYYGAGYSQAQSGYSSAGYGKIILDHLESIISTYNNVLAAGLQ